MEQRYPVGPDEIERLSTNGLRENFLIDSIFVEGAVTAVYSHLDRVVVGGAWPGSPVAASPVTLAGDQAALATDTFLERREIGIINVGGSGTVSVGDSVYQMAPLDCLYVGSGDHTVTFESDDAAQAAKFYFMSTTAHASQPTVHATLADANRIDLGSDAGSNTRTIYQYIHEDGIASCQLVMGLTLLAPNNMWNTMPPHLHARRMETYFYFGLPDDNLVVHLMGDPENTRHVVVRNEQAVLSPPWSIHAGMGTSSYGFIWAMAGENQCFADMDVIDLTALR